MVGRLGQSDVPRWLTEVRHRPWRLLLSAGLMLWVLTEVMQANQPMGSVDLSLAGVVCLSAAVLAVGWWRTRVRYAGRLWLAGLGLVLLCVWVFAWGQWHLARYHQAVIAPAWNEVVQVWQVRLTSQPVRTAYGWRFEIEPTATQGSQNPRMPQKLSLFWADAHLPVPIEQLRAGQIWRLPLHIRPAVATHNEGVFDLEDSWRVRGIQGLATVRVYQHSRAEERPLLLGEAWSFRAMVENGRFDALQSLRLATNQITRVAPEYAQASGVFLALTMGEQREISAAQWALFQDTGVTHLVSISGIHVTLLAGVLAFLGQKLWRRSARRVVRMPALFVAQWVALIGAWAYAVFAGWGLPAERTVVMLALWLVLTRLGVAQSGQRVLALSVFWVVLFEPFAVLNLGFWLSYSAVAWLIFVFEPAMGDLARAREGKEAVADAPKLSIWIRGLRWLLTAVVAQLGIGVALIPISLHFFHYYSALGLLVNVLAIPVMTLLLLPLLLSALLTLLTGWSMPVVVMTAVLGEILQGLAVIAPWADGLDWVGYLSAYRVLGLFAVSVLGARWLRYAWTSQLWRQVSSRGRVVMAVSLGGLVCGFFWGLQPQPVFTPIAQGHLRVTVLDIGQGSAVLLQSASQTWLYDTGPRYGQESDAAARIVVPHLRYLGIRQIDTLVLSHNDHDHTGGTRSVLRHFAVRRVLSSLTEAQLADLGWRGATQGCQAGQLEWFDGVQLAVLAPTEPMRWAQDSTDNQKSCVLRFAVPLQQPATTERLGSVLLTGDIDHWAEAVLLSDPAGGVRMRDPVTGAPWQSDLVFMPHHGSDGSSSALFVSATRPQWAVAQAGRFNPFGHPKSAVLARYQAAGAMVWRTDLQHGRVFWLGD